MNDLVVLALEPKNGKGHIWHVHLRVAWTSMIALAQLQVRHVVLGV